ncbi:MAG: hypothetical protein H7308_02410 [Chthonomonadaceae bacterium]|nr:hypothetical protein [Chthonomonadaceae bacterium]
MGYDLRVTRCTLEVDEEITREEWLEVVDNDPELTIDESNGPYFAVWSGPGKYPCWIDYSSGDLWSKYPTDEFIEKMVQIAKLLGGRVQGDDGEIYPGGGQPPYKD